MLDSKPEPSQGFIGIRLTWLTSPRRRARRTAELAGFADAEPDEDLVEWAYGDYEGITTPEIR